MGPRKPLGLLVRTQDPNGPHDSPSDPTSYGPDYYNQRFEVVDQQRKPTKHYAKDTEEAIARMECKWKEYCDYVDIDPDWTLKKAVTGRFTNFLHWMCNKFMVKKVSSVETYWRTLSQLYNKLKGRRMDPMILAQMAEFIHEELADEHDLDESETDKPLLDVEDFWEVLQCHWVTDTNKFPHERQRVQLACILLFAAYTSSRPGALLGITYGDLELFVQRDSKTGATELMLRVKLTKTKSRKKRARPKTYSFTLDDNPFFCVPSHFVALAQDDAAFEKLPDGSPLTTERILAMGVRPGLNSQAIPFKRELADVPLFRMPVQTGHGIETSPDAALAYAKYNEWLKRLGTETGFAQVLTAYCLRRASGNAINDDPNANDAVRNLAMDHTDSKIFQRNYLSRVIRYDVQAAYRGTEPKTDLIRAAGRMSRLMDPRRPKKISKAQRDSILCEPKIQQLCAVQEELYLEIRKEFKFICNAEGEAIYEEYRRARLNLYGAIRSRERAVLDQGKKEYDATVPLQDMLEQISGNTESINANFKVGEINYSFPERFRIAKAFLDSKMASFSETNARAAFVNDVTSLCTRLETQVHTRKRKLTHDLDKIEREHIDSDGDIKPTLDADSPISNAARVDTKSAAFSLPVKCKSFQCLICLGNARLPWQDRFHNYGSRDSLKRHFHRKHKTFECNSPCPHPDRQCAGVVLTSGMHFLNHAATVHGIFMDAKTWSAVRR